MAIRNAIDLFQRIRWSTVLGLLGVIAVVIIVIGLVAYVGSRTGDGGVGLKVKLNPDDVKAGGKSVLHVEVKNKDPESTVTIRVKAETFDPAVYFVMLERFDTHWMEDVAIGPKETRKLSVNVRVKPDARAGRYRIDVTGSDYPGTTDAEESVFLEITAP